MEDKINYIIQILNILVNQAKNIGVLVTYTLGSDDANSYVAVYNSTSNDTKKVILEDLVADLAGKVTTVHSHVIADVIGLSEALAAASFFTDPSGNKWSVTRNSGDYDYDTLLIYDHIAGWEDEATRLIWIEGIIMDANLTLPADIRTTKVFITNEKMRI